MKKILAAFISVLAILVLASCSQVPPKAIPTSYILPSIPQLQSQRTFYPFPRPSIPTPPPLRTYHPFIPLHNPAWPYVKMKENWLSSLTFSRGLLSPVFSSTTTRYKLELFEDTDNVTITALTRPFSFAKASYPEKVKLKKGETKKVTVKVRSESGKYRYYRITIHRAPSSNAALASIDLGSPSCSLSPAFDPAVVSYTVLLPPGITSLKVTAKPADKLSKVAVQASINGTAKKTNKINVLPGQTAFVTIYVTAQSGYKMEYDVTISAAGP